MSCPLVWNDDDAYACWCAPSGSQVTITVLSTTATIIEANYNGADVTPVVRTTNGSSVTFPVVSGRHALILVLLGGGAISIVQECGEGIRQKIDPATDFDTPFRFFIFGVAAEGAH